MKAWGWAVFTVVAGVALAGCDSSSITDPVEPVDTTSTDAAPQANAGDDQNVYVGETADLDGYDSSDPDGDALTYAWALTDKPDSSSATVSSSEVTASLTPDVPGSYTVRLTVSDGTKEATDDVVVTAGWDLRLSGTISNDTTLHDLGAPYEVPDGVTFTGAVVVDPGVTIELGSGASIAVASGGSLKAVGTETDSIHFVGSTDSPGWHSGIEFSTLSPNNELKYVEVADGGANGWSNVYVAYNGAVKISNSLLRDGTEYGIEVDTQGQLGAFANNTFTGLTKGALSIYANHIGALDAASSYDSTSVILVNGGTADAAATWPKTDAPYLVDYSMSVAAPVTVSPGAVFRFAQATYLEVESGGSFAAVGTASDTIRFVGDEATAGYWRGLLIETVNTANELTYVEVANAGAGGSGAVDIWYDGMIKITHSLLRSNLSYGVDVDTQGQLSGFAANEFRGNAAPMRVYAQHLGRLDAATLYAGGNTDDRVEIAGGASVGTVTWPAVDGGYFVTYSFSAASAVTVQAGARFEFDQGQYMEVEGTGASLNATGTALDPIVFTGNQAVAGYWRGILIETMSTSNILDHVDIGYGGTGGGNIEVWYDGMVTVTNSEIHHSSNWGITRDSSGGLTQSGNYFHDNASGDINLP